VLVQDHEYFVSSFFVHVGPLSTVILPLVHQIGLKSMRLSSAGDEICMSEALGVIEHGDDRWRPFNNEQIEIVQRLDRSDGIVVQGPPGTGKTHAISNIIGHYMATGRRVTWCGLINVITCSAFRDERIQIDQNIAKTFERLVRERTFYALGGSMTGPVRSALMMFATALRKIGKGTGKGAVRHRKDARTAMSQCYGATPCWIMPSWRVAEQLPAELGSFDLVIIDEASQSDIREVTALLRGKKILVVGDDKQVSPTAAFIEDAKIERLARGFLKNQPFKTLLLPGASLYDLAKVMFPDKLSCCESTFAALNPSSAFRCSFIPSRLFRFGYRPLKSALLRPCWTFLSLMGAAQAIKSI
jgi:hypothetical protein